MTTTPLATRLVAGVPLPVAGTWTIDPGHSEVAFVGRHFMIAKVRGRFTDVRGTLRFAVDPAESTLDVTIGMASVESGSAVRDEHLRSAELFDVATFTEAAFRSTAIDWNGTRGTVHGDLTIHGITRNMALETGGILVSKEIRIEIEVETVLG